MMMLKKILIALVLFTASANADFFQALKDAAAKAIEEQNKLNNARAGDSTSTDQAPAPQFNSLAEEAAYKKRQEEAKTTDAKQYEKELRSNLIPRIQRLRASEANFYQKYLVKQNDKQEMIDSKFKNRVQLYQDLQTDFVAMDAEREQIYTILDNNKFSDFSDVQSKVISEHFKEATWYACQTTR